MSLIINSILSTIFSYTGYLWGFILGAIAIEELEEFKKTLKQLQNVFLLILSAVILYLAVSIFETSNVLAILLLILTAIIILIQQKIFSFISSKQFYQEISILILVSISYLIILISNIGSEKILLINSAFLFYSLLAGINLHNLILHGNKAHKKKKTKKK
jgi:hypothetical protein